MIELEAKVRLSYDEKSKVLEKLKSFTEFVWEKNKEDFYFWQKWQYPLFRLRKENGKNIVTKKNHIIKNWIETNEEVEFEVSDFSSFCDFAKSLWYENSFTKIKKSLFFKYWEFNLELCEVSPLGWFLEIEILSEEKEIEANKKKLIEIFWKFWFNEKDFERKRYLELLK